MSKRLRLVVALACAALALVLCLAYARGVRAEADEAKRQALEAYGGQIVAVVVATQQLEASETITESDVELRDYLVDLVPDGALPKFEDALGKNVTSPVAAGSVLCSLHFRDAGTSLSVPSGRVAVTVALSDKIGVPSDIEPGSSLVAYATADKESRLVSADAQVLAVRPREGVSGVATITLAVSPNDVPALLSASVRENLRLVLPANDVVSLGGAEATGSTVPATPPEAPTNVPVEQPLDDGA